MREWAKSLGLAFILFIIIRIFLVQAFKIPTGSMESTLLVGDFLLVNKLVYGASTPRKLPLLDVEIPAFKLPGYESPQKGDIVVFEYPNDREVDYVKRCVAAGGDTVEMRDKQLYVNSVPQVEPYAKYNDPRMIRKNSAFYGSSGFSWQRDYLADFGESGSRRDYHPTRDNFGPLVVPGGSYFCLGDNRDFSSDSRYWGFVKEELIKGRPLILYFSWNKENKLPRLERIGQIIQ